MEAEKYWRLKLYFMVATQASSEAYYLYPALSLQPPKAEVYLVGQVVKMAAYVAGYLTRPVIQIGHGYQAHW